MRELKTRHQILRVTRADQLPGRGWEKGACLLHLSLYAHDTNRQGRLEWQVGKRESAHSTTVLVL